ncbi:chromodomain Y-like protein 2 [Glandiceps talaboti]
MPEEGKMAAPTEVYEVETIRARRKNRKGKIEYLVKWRNYGSDDDTWEPVTNLRQCMQFVDAYNERIQKNKNSTKSTIKKTAMLKKNKMKINKKKTNNKHKKVDKSKSKHSKPKLNDIKAKQKNKVMTNSIPQPKSKKPRLDECQSLSSGSDLSDLDFLTSDDDDDDIRYQLADHILHTGNSTGKRSTNSNAVKTVTKHPAGSKAQPPKNVVNGKPAAVKMKGQCKGKDTASQISTNSTSANKITNAGEKNDNGTIKVTPMITPIMEEKCEKPAEGLHAPSKLINKAESPLVSYKALLGSSPRKHLPERATKRKLSELNDDEPMDRRYSVRQSESVFKYKEIVVKKAPGYTQIWLFTNTAAKNAINPQVCKELINALYNATYDDSKVVMLSGSGSVFCSGIDLNFFLSKPTEERRKTALLMVDALKEFIDAVIKFPKLLVAAVNGPAVGLGVSLLPLCDVVYASDKACFHTPYARLAQTPEGCASYTFPVIMGPAMANEMLLAGRKLTALEACQKGLVSQVFWPTSFMQEVIPRLQNMAAASGKGLQISKALIRSHLKGKLEFTNDSECTALQERWGSAEVYKAIQKFVEEERDELCL